MQIEQIKPNSTIKIEFSTSFYQRIQQLVIRMTENTPQEELTASFTKMKNSEELTSQEIDLETLLILTNTLEVNAREQDLVETIEVPDAAVAAVQEAEVVETV